MTLCPCYRCEFFTVKEGSDEAQGQAGVVAGGGAGRECQGATLEAPGGEGEGEERGRGSEGKDAKGW